MLTIVLILNGLIGLGCLLVAWQLWRLKRQLANAADTLTAVERKVHRVLSPAPKYILMGQSGTHHLRKSLEGVEPQLQRIQQIMKLLSLSQIFWRCGFFLSPASKFGKRRIRNR
ncbi:hypothetical protein [Leptothermofonsia sp. ETS-13]|uniref:hypothetical protein n=1 Tax=Leptothermofonsia sp. ETS-13 TaxID=3035696 RepID=UPI003BA0D8DC